MRFRRYFNRIAQLPALNLALLALPVLAADGQSLAPVQMPEVPVLSSTLGSSDLNSTAIDRIRGVVRAVHQATLSAAIDADIDRLPFRPGQAFKKGDLLVGFNCEQVRAEARAAKATVEIQTRTLETNTTLEKYDSIGLLEVQISRSQVNKAQAEADALETRVKGCRIRAPFAGFIVEQLTNEHESVAARQPLLKIVDTSNLEVDLIVPSSWLTWLKPDAAFRFHIDEIDATLSGSVVRLLPVVDPVSKTLKVIGTLKLDEKNHGQVLPGMSGTAVFTDKPKGSRHGG